jgi:hypothetical protein
MASPFIQELILREYLLEEYIEHYLTLYKIRYWYLKLCGLSTEANTVTKRWSETVIDRCTYSQPIKENYVLEVKWRRLKKILTTEDVSFLDALFQEYSKDSLKFCLNNFINKFDRYRCQQCHSRLEDAFQAFTKWRIHMPKTIEGMDSC